MTRVHLEIAACSWRVGGGGGVGYNKPANYEHCTVMAN